MILSEDNKIVHGLWVGNKLSSMELLTLKSFTHFSHEFHLWVYEPLQNELPKGVIIRDANEIIPASGIFRRKFDDPIYKIGKGSIGAPFSDLFRYKLLYEHGGWWVDMDVTCLQPFTIKEPYFFRAHPILPMIGNIIKVPAKSELMRLAYEQTLAECDENTLEWLLPNKILNQHIENLNLHSFIVGDRSTIDWWEKVDKFITGKAKFPENWLFIHWMNEEWRMRGLDKNAVFKQTTIGSLYTFYQLRTIHYPTLLRIKNWIKHLKNKA